MTQEIIQHINQLVQEDEPFIFIINYQGDKAYIKKLSEIEPHECLYDFDGKTNIKDLSPSGLPSKIRWKVMAPSFSEYAKSFDIVKRNIMAGNSYLTNLTCQIPIECNLSLYDVFFHSQGKYKLLMNNDEEGLGTFVCFSPETFVKIRNGRIYSYPMKGTISAEHPDAELALMEDKKEAAEHATIVDLIRNDLSRVATGVRVDRYRYIDLLHTNKGDILQTSSEISGKLPDDYQQHIGEFLSEQLPAGSITGAPKDKTCAIIHEAETYERGFYTGIMGIYQDGELDSAVMIRFMEKTEQGMVFKAGGGITSKSDCHKEYEEVLQKVYLPITNK